MNKTRLRCLKETNLNFNSYGVNPKYFKKNQ